MVKIDPNIIVLHSEYSFCGESPFSYGDEKNEEKVAALPFNNRTTALLFGI